MKTLYRPLLGVRLATTALACIAGCDAGDTNPVSPQKMEEIRNKTNQERANFQPPTGAPPKPTN